MNMENQEEMNVMQVMFTVLARLLSPCIVCDRTGRIIFANNPYKALTSKNTDQQFFWTLFPNSESMPVYFQKAVEQGMETRSEITFNEMAFISRTIPLSDILINEVLYMLYFEDVTPSVNLTRQLKIENRLLQKSFLDSISAFSNVVESRDAYTSGHQKRVASLAVNIATRANITDRQLINAIYYGALMHDIGKVAIPMEYLVTPRLLTVHEYEIVKTHVTIGHKIISHIDFPWDIQSVVYQHHERLNGSGYPNGLKGDQITVPARIVGIADVFEAMSTDRPYRKHVAREIIFDYFRENRGILFDPYYIDCFFQCVSELKDVYEMNPTFKPFDLYDSQYQAL